MVLLAILDGLGLRSDSKDNAVCLAKTPTLERLVRECPNIPIDGSGLAVGLPEGQMGNSEVGHLNIGAGRVVYQDITLIDKSIRDGDFFSNPVLATGMKALKTSGGALHLLGLVSDGCVHSSLYHLSALIRMSALFKLPQVYLHAFTDGRDTSPTAGAGYIDQALGYFKEFGIGKLATVIGRYWAMDRDRRWERTQLAFDAMINRKGVVVADPIAALKKQYKAGETDEFVKPLIIEQESDADATIKKGDLVVCFNFRADRLRQICYFLTGSNLKGAPAPEALGVDLITMTKYDGGLEAKIAFPPRSMNSILAEVVSNHSLKQLRIAETEKYPHVTFFFNGGREEPFPGEERKLIASPYVTTYDLKPEMSSVAVTDELCARIRSREYDLIILNFANPDMVGHTGSLPATIKAVEAVDTGLGRVLAALDEVDGDALITADHGNAETMIDPKTGGPLTSHTTSLVPLIFCGPRRNLFFNPRSNGVLADIAPTILELLGIDKPEEMTGRSFVRSN